MSMSVLVIVIILGFLFTHFFLLWLSQRIFRMSEIRYAKKDNEGRLESQVKIDSNNIQLRSIYSFDEIGVPGSVIGPGLFRPALLGNTVLVGDSIGILRNEEPDSENVEFVPSESGVYAISVSQSILYDSDVAGIGGLGLRISSADLPLSVSSTAGFSLDAGLHVDDLSTFVELTANVPLKIRGELLGAGVYSVQPGSIRIIKLSQ